jgi:hypothetical protein
MLFHRYRKLVQIPAAGSDEYAAALDAGHTITSGGLEVKVTSMAECLVQVGYTDAQNSFSPLYTRISDPGITSDFSFPDYVNDGSQAIGIHVTNLSNATADVYLELDAIET